LSKTVRINEQIRTREVRLIGPEGENLGNMPTEEALGKARELDLDLIEVVPNAVPPVAKIADYGKYQYDEKKKQKASKAKVQQVEVKSIQVKIGTGEHDLALKARKASEWLKEGHKIKIELFLFSRYKYMERSFLEERLQRVLNLISEEYKISDSVKKSPKGLTVIIEKK